MISFPFCDEFNIDPNSISITERLFEFDYSASITSLTSPSREGLLKILENISDRDTYSIQLIIGNNDPISNNNLGDIDSFIQKISKVIEFIEEEVITFHFKIIKNKIDDKISVYDLEAFESLFETLSLTKLLQILKQIKEDSQRILFVLLNEDFSFGTDTFWFGKIFPDKKPDNQDEILNSIRENCHFGNIEQYPFSPFVFNLSNCSNYSGKFVRIFDRLTLIFSLVSLFNITTVTDSVISLRLVGYKVIDITLDPSAIKLSEKSIYFQIFRWIYSENSKVSDKLDLARNILSLSINQNDLSIDEDILISIKSSYQIYQKENINRYIEIRNKIIDQLLFLSKNATQAINNYIDNFKKSIFAFLSFFISVFVLRVLSNGGFTDVLTKDATIMSLCFLLISVLFLIFSLWEFSTEKSRLDTEYKNIKTRFTDLLLEKDIDRILNNDQEYKSCIENITKKKNAYLLLWLIIIFFFLFAIFSISTYINWTTIFPFVSSIHHFLSYLPILFNIIWLNCH